jgi:hypothetical protein
MRAGVLADIGVFNQLRAGLDKVGSGADMAKAQMQGWPGVVEGVSNAMGELRLSIFDTFNSPEVAAGGQKLVEALDHAGDWVKAHQPEIIDGLTTVAATFTKTGEVIADFVSVTARGMGMWVGAITSPMSAVLAKLGEFISSVGKAMSFIPGMGDLATKVSDAGASAISGAATLRHGPQDYYNKIADAADILGDGLHSATDWIHQTGNSMADAARDRRYREGVGGFAGNSFGELPAEPTPPGPLPGPGVSMGGNTSAGGPGSSALDSVALDPNDSRAVLDAKRAVIAAENDLQESKLKLTELEKKGTTDQSTLLKAKNAVHENELKLQSAQMKLAEAQNGTLKKMQDSTGKFADGMDKIGAALDADFGISKGLPGIAENLVKFLASLAMAPVMGALQGVVNASGYDPQKHGSGLFGIFGGMFGGSGGGMSGLSSGAGVVSPGGNVGAMLALAQAASGKTAYGPASDLANGLADCSGSISDLYEVLTTGQSTGARMFTTTNFASDAEAAKLGFLPGYMPGALNVGVNPYPGQSGHMAATLPNGVNFEGGGGTGGGAQYGGSAAGALDPQFEKHYYFPTGASGLMPGGAAAGGSALAAASGGATPVFVVNMPGGGFAGGGTPAPPPSAGQPGGAGGGAPSGPGSTSAPSAPGWPGGSPVPDVPGQFSPENTDPGLNNPPDPNVKGSPGRGYPLKWKLNGPFKRDGGGSGSVGVGGTSDLGGSVFVGGSGTGSITAPNATGSGGIPLNLYGQGQLTANNLGVQSGIGSGTSVGGFSGSAGSNVPVGAFDQFSGQAQGHGLLDATGTLGLNAATPPPAGGTGAGSLPPSAGGLSRFGLSAGGQGAGVGGWGGAPGTGAVQGSPVGGQAFPAMGGGGFAGVGGAPLAAVSAAASGLDMLAPGAGAAAQIGIQLANRAAAWAGQAAGIGVSGLMETLLPAGDNPMASIGNSWLGKIASGVAGARPQLPNMAGTQAPPPNPNGGSGQSGPGSNYTQNNNVTVTNDVARKNLDEPGIVRELQAMHMPPGR